MPDQRDVLISIDVALSTALRSHGLHPENDTVRKTAILVLDTLRSLPVEQRMEAMGMVPFRYGTDDGGGEYAIVWGESRADIPGDPDPAESDQVGPD